MSDKPDLGEKTLAEWEEWPWQTTGAHFMDPGDPPFRGAANEVGALIDEVRALREQVAVLEASLLAGRAEVKGLKAKLDQLQTEERRLYRGWSREESSHSTTKTKHAKLVRLVREYFSARESYVTDPGVDTSAQLDRARHALLKAADVRGAESDNGANTPQVPGASGSGEGASGEG